MAGRRAMATLLLSATMLSACMHGRQPPTTLGPSAANFTYYSPTTRLSLVGHLTLLRCDAGPRGVVVSSDLSLAAAAGADTSAPFMLRGESLMSAMQRRELAIELYDNGTIRSLNASSADRTGTVLTNILKTVASVAGAFIGAGSPVSPGQQPETPRPTPGPCNQETRDALRQATEFRSALSRLRRSLVGASPADVESIRVRMDLIAHQLALIITSQLTVPVNKALDLGDNPPAPGTDVPVRLTLRDLARWFADQSVAAASCVAVPQAADLFASGGNSCQAEATVIGLAYRVSATDVAPVAARVRQSRCVNNGSEADECGRTLVIPRPARATVVFVTTTGNIAGQPAGSVLGQAAVSMPQWGAANYLPVNVRAFQSRSVGYTFSSFGERRSFKWNSEATAENATAAIASATEVGAGIVETVRGRTELERLTAENAELEARMANNRLRRCEQAILAGAMTCE